MGDQRTSKQPSERALKGKIQSDLFPRSGLEQRDPRISALRLGHATERGGRIEFEGCSERNQFHNAVSFRTAFNLEYRSVVPAELPLREIEPWNKNSFLIAGTVFHYFFVRTLGVLPSVMNKIAPPSLKLMLNTSESDDIPPMPDRTLPFRAVATARLSLAGPPTLGS